jgi:two-component system sensor histidine kinase UhpB
MSERGDLPLAWKVFLLNGAVLAVAVLALVLTPFRVSPRPVVSEVLVLGFALLAMLVTTGVLLRAHLSPVDRVVREMDSVEDLAPGDRLVPPRSGPGARLVAAYNGMLDRLETERASSDARALAAQEAERHRVAQELHDQIGQSLTVVLLGLKQLESRVPPEVAEDLVLLRESARSGLDDVRRVARELRPGVLDDLGLVPALAALTQDFTAHTGAPVRRAVAPGLPSLPAATELVVYRVAQEALTNAHRHAGAAEVRLTLTRVGDRVVLEVADDGRGTSRLVPGAGVRGMHERARLVGGELTLVSRPRRGTTVTLSVPAGSHG